MRIAAVYRCVAIYAGIVGYLPLNTFESVGDDTRRLAKEIPEYSILKKKTNRRQTSNKWRRQVMAQVLLQGNSYNQILTTGRRGPVSEILPLDSNRMDVGIDGGSGRLQYKYTQPGGEVINFPPESILHFMGPSLDGVTGLSAISYCRQTMELTKQAERSATAFYQNNAQPVGALSHPLKLSADAHARIKESWQKTYGGASNRGRVAILEEGVTYQPITMSARDSQYIEIRKFQIAEIARLFGMPLPMLGDLDNAHFNNVANLFQIFLTVSLTDILTMIEQEIDAKLFLGTDFYAKFNVSGLLRGDIEARSKSLEIQARNGVINPDEWRALEDMNPRGDDDAKLYQRQMNMVYEPLEAAAGLNAVRTPATKTADPVSKDPENSDPAPEPKSRKIPTSTFRSIFLDGLERIFVKESKRLESGLRQESKRFEYYMRSFYTSHGETVITTLRPIVRGYLDLAKTFDVEIPEDAEERFLNDFSARCVRSSLEDIENLGGEIRGLQELVISFHRDRPSVWADAALTLLNSVIGVPYDHEN
jgi:HK97 family phage portal protein